MSMLVKFRQCHFIIPPDTNAIFRRVERVVASLSLLGLELLGTMVERDLAIWLRCHRTCCFLYSSGSFSRRSVIQSSG